MLVVSIGKRQTNYDIFAIRGRKFAPKQRPGAALVGYRGRRGADDADCAVMAACGEVFRQSKFTGRGHGWQVFRICGAVADGAATIRCGKDPGAGEVGGGNCRGESPAVRPEPADHGG